MWPPGGWKYLEAATGWRAPEGLTFDQTVQAIIQHRMANRQYRLATDPELVAQQLDDYTCARLKNSPSWCSTDTPESFTVPLPKRSQHVEAGGVAGGVRHLANTGAGIKLWIDWFGEGKPVDKTTAEKRAKICSECPKNAKMDIWQWFTGVAAKELKAIFSVLHDLDLRTSRDETLRVCKACDCPLKAKVWAPIHIIKKHLSQETQAKLVENCWIRNE